VDQLSWDLKVAQVGPYQEPRQRDNGADVQYLIKKKNRGGICQFCSVPQSLLCPVNPQMYPDIDASRHPKPK
jgi:hypothetical protein